MADKRITDFATLTEAQDDDLLLVASEDETYNIKVGTIKEAVKGNADRAEAAAKAAQASAEEAAEQSSEALNKAEEANRQSTQANTAAKQAAANATNAQVAAQSAQASAQAAAQSLADATEAVEAINEFEADYEEMKATLAGKVDNAYVEEGYLFMTSGDDVVVGPLGPFSGGGGGGGGATASIIISNVVKATSVRNGADAIFSFTAAATDDTNLTVVWAVDGIVRNTSADKQSGTTFSFNAKDYIRQSDTSTVKVTITSESGATLNRQWSVTASAFSLSWGSAIQPITLYTANASVYAVVNVSAQAKTENIVTIAVGENRISRNIVGSKSVTFELDKSMFAPGVNTITATMVSSTDETDVATPIKYTAIWGYGATAPIVAFEGSEQEASQFDIAPIRYLVFDPDNETATCSMQIGTEAARNLNADRTMQTLNYIPQEYGNITVTLSCGDSSATMTLVAVKSQYNIGKITGDNLRYDLDPVGHANTDADRADFGSLSFSEGFDWVNGGFQTDENGAAFVVKKGHRATLPRQLFGDADGNGKTVDISFKIKNSDNYNAVAMQELNNGSTKGLILRTNEGELRLNNATGQLFRYCEENRIDLSINVEQLNDQRVMTVWLDGVPAQVNAYSAGTLVQDENSLVIGSDNCDVWVYAIRVYNSALSYKEMIQNWISLGSNTAEKIERCKDNDVYDDNGMITQATLHKARPDLTIVHISAERMTTNKEDPVDGVVTIQDGSTVLNLDSNTVFKVQGTSSAAYGRAAYNLDIDFSESGKEYAISANAIPVDYINIKVNVASSECANNICAADLYNKFQPYLVPARENPAVRDTVEGKPCAVFFTNTSSNNIWVGSQQLRPGDTILYAMGDICNSKKNRAVFGQDGKGEHYCKGCIEVSGNDTAAQQFKATSTYNPEADEGKGEWQTTVAGKTSKDYEWRAKPKAAADVEEVINAWNEAVAWVVSTIGNSEKFKAEVGNYFAINSLLYHFLWLEFYAGFDNVSKNTFYSYEWDSTAGKYLWNITKNYDDDTILGCDNDGFPLADYGADFGDKVGGRSLFNADTHTIWVNIKEAYGPELDSMYVTLRSKGAWSAATIIDKWDNYQNVRPRAAMAEDAYNKYILPYKTTGVTVGTEVKSYDDSYLARLQGSKTYQRKQFVTYQAKYMDGKHGYYSTAESIKFRANAPDGTTQDLTIKAYAKTYVTIIVDNGTKVSKKIETGGTAVFENTAVHSNATIYVTPESLISSVRPIDKINNSTFSAAGATKLENVELGSAESENTAWDANTGLNIPSVLLKDLSIRNVVNFSKELNLAANVELETLDTRGTNAGMITLPSYAPLKEVHLNSCSGIKALNLKSVTDFSATTGNNLVSVWVENCNSVVNDAVAVLLGHAVNFGGIATRYLRITGVDWTFDTADVLCAIANSWKGYNTLGETTATPVITGSCYVSRVSEAELTTLIATFPLLNVTYGEIVPAHTVTFKNYDGTILHTQSVKENSAAVNPVTAGLIPAPTKSASVEYNYTFSGWDMSFNHILQDTVITATYAQSDRYYTVRYIDGTVAIQTDSVVAHGSTSYRGEVLSGAGIWIGWDVEANDVVSDMEIYAQYLVPVLPDMAATGYDYLYSDDPNDNSGYTLAEFYGIISSGLAKTYFSVGDKIKIVPNTNVFVDSEIIMPLYGFNHYKLSGGTEFASCVFGMLGVMNATRQMNTSNTNVGGWDECAMRKWLNGTVFNALPMKWQSMIKAVDVLTSIGNTSANIKASSDKLFLFSQAEVGFNKTEVPYRNEVDADAEQVTFALFTDAASRIKKTYNGEGSATTWWLRSPLASSGTYFCYVNSNGISYNYDAGYAYGVAFGFCI